MKGSNVCIYGWVFCYTVCNPSGFTREGSPLLCERRIITGFYDGGTFILRYVPSGKTWCCLNAGHSRRLAFMENYLLHSLDICAACIGYSSPHPSKYIPAHALSKYNQTLPAFFFLSVFLVVSITPTCSPSSSSFLLIAFILLLPSWC